jgi:hypothetical protein
VLSRNAGGLKHAAQDVLQCGEKAQINHRVVGKGQGGVLWPLRSVATDLSTMCLLVQVFDLRKTLSDVFGELTR